MFSRNKIMAVIMAACVTVAPTATAATTSPQGSPIVTQPRTSDFSSLKDGESLRLREGISVTKQSGRLIVASPADEERSICATSVATVLFGMGSVALFALAAALGPGEVAVIAGVEMTAEQLGYAAGASGSFAALEAWADSKVCN
ncbi:MULTISPECIES: hypothetical protein [Corynebacterium]|uniref:hypothetical protein n=1 Tax=Corynebacterium TaxID=1716 RepID=UPI00114C92D6|nr:MULTISPECIES: hypothetical protein [Corynebacterium]